jgi:hypothetical protein
MRFITTFFLLGSRRETRVFTLKEGRRIRRTIRSLNKILDCVGINVLDDIYKYFTISIEFDQ